MNRNDMIFKHGVTCPWDNPYQGKDLRILFICSAGILRSATMARMYAGKYNTRCAGSHSYALIPVTPNLLAWAQRIVFVHQSNKLMVEKKFDLNEWFEPHEITVLNIPDDYDHMNPELCKIIEQQFEKV